MEQFGKVYKKSAHVGCRIGHWNDSRLSAINESRYCVFCVTISLNFKLMQRNLDLSFKIRATYFSSPEFDQEV